MPIYYVYLNEGAEDKMNENETVIDKVKAIYHKAFHGMVGSRNRDLDHHGPDSKCKVPATIPTTVD